MSEKFHVLSFSSQGDTAVSESIRPTFKGAVAENLLKMSHFIVFFFIGENLSLGFGWSHVKTLWACKHGNPPKIGGMYVL